MKQKEKDEEEEEEEEGHLSNSWISFIIYIRSYNEHDEFIVCLQSCAHEIF